MPRYFIDFQDGDVFDKDEEGCVLLDLQQACDEAVAMLPQIAKDELSNGEHREFIATVREEGGPLLYRATLTFRGERLS